MRDRQNRKLGGWTSGVVRRSRPIVRTSAHRLARPTAALTPSRRRDLAWRRVERGLSQGTLRWSTSARGFDAGRLQAMRI